MRKRTLVVGVLTAVAAIGALGRGAADAARLRPALLRARLPPYFPTRDTWEARTPSQAGMDDALVAAAVEWAKGQETDMPRDFSTQAEIFGRPLGPVPKDRAATNGIILRHGYIVAEWGDTGAVDPSYSMAKSYLSTILGVTIDRGKIADVREPVARLVHDGGYDPPHNAQITWEHHVTQTSEWEGTLFGKPHTFIGREEFGRGERGARELHEPGTFYEYNDVRVNRLALSLLRVWGRPLPEVLKSEIMDPIGASDTWVYHGYDNSFVEVAGRNVPSVSGGTRWGGGLWMSTRDHARFGLLMLRRGEWDGKRIVSEEWIAAATSDGAGDLGGRRQGYGYLWWLNSGGRWEGAPRTSFAALGAGSNSIWIDPEHELVVVWRWHKEESRAELYRRVVGAVKE
jgi:CubicO group peptidase (beta-lactamase class C family)